MDLVLLHPELGIVPALIMLGLAVLLGFYLCRRDKRVYSVEPG